MSAQNSFWELQSLLLQQKAGEEACRRDDASGASLLDTSLTQLTACSVTGVRWLCAVEAGSSPSEAIWG